MTKKYVITFAAAAIGAGFLAVNAYAHGFGHRGHRGSSAAMSCIAVMTPTQKANLKQVFEGNRQKLRDDSGAVKSAKEALAGAILSGSKDVSAQETELSKAKLQLQKDKDAAAMQVCGQLDAKQLSAAETLHKNLATLRENSHEQARNYFQAARTAAGAAQTQE
jgi:hypothetical protein